MVCSSDSPTVEPPPDRQDFSVGPVGGAAVAGLVDLGLLLHAAGLAALTRTTLSVLGQVMVQQLGVGLLVRHDVKEGGRGVASRGPAGIQRPRAPQRRRQAEGRRSPGVETLLVEGLALIVNTSADVWHSRVTGRHGDAFPRAASSRLGLSL